MIYFNNDYMIGAHPKVLERLVATNNLYTKGYGRDEFTARARRLILDACGLDEGEVFLLEGGTQTNAVVIDRLLDHNDGVIAADTAHINVHEAGAIESNGHKVITLPGCCGKLRAEDVGKYAENFVHDDMAPFMVRPAMVYVTYPTELGTLYTRAELEALRQVCDRYDMTLYIDGARLTYGLGCEDTDLTLKDIAAIADVFYIGGTKCGALFGEAVVTRRPELLPRFVSLIKLHGATLAKGRLLGVQFEALFTDGLYLEIGRHAVKMAMKLRDGLKSKGYMLLSDSPTNQQFVMLDNDVIDRLRPEVSFDIWGTRGERRTAVRFVTDWSTDEADINALLMLL